MATSRGLGRRLGYNAFRGVRRILSRNVLDKRARERPLWLHVRIDSSIEEQRTRGPHFGPDSPSLALVDLLRALDSARRDPRVEGVVLRFEGSPGGFARAATLRRAIGGLRASGKLVWAWAESFDAMQYYVACAADRVELPESGGLHLVGLRSQQWFFREGLDKLGIRAEVVKIGSNKAAAEPFVRRNMSQEQREQVDRFQAELFDEIVSSIALGRGLEEDTVRRHIDEGPHSAAEAVERGLFDGCSYPDELERSLRALHAPVPESRAAFVGSGELEVPSPDDPEDDDTDGPLVDVASYFALHAGDNGWQPLRSSLPRLAYVVAGGAIGRGRSQRGVASQRYAALLGELMRDDDTRAVVLRIDSPGGDAVASDVLHHAVERLAARKPVVVTMGEVAASGGYYIAAAAHRILAERVTLTGSIGVVGGKLDLSGLYRRLGIDVEVIERGERAGLHSETRGFTPEERRAVQEQMRAIYDTFKERVARGRSLEPAAVEAVAQGRIWSGERARSLGLVDALGGPLEAIAEACDRIGLAPSDRVVLDVYPHRSAFAGVRSLLGPFGAGARVHLD